MRDFRAALRDLSTRRTVLAGPDGADLRAYYEEEFLSRLQNEEGKRDSVESYLPELPSVRYLQSQYIVSHLHPVGEKDRLAQSDERCLPYHGAHANYHDDFRPLRQKLDFYDVFLVEPERGLRTGLLRASLVPVSWPGPPDGLF